MSEQAGMINAYFCGKCHKGTVTINRDSGTTPFMIRCRRLGCDGMAQSSFYQVDQYQRPSEEWYKPDDDELSEAEECVRNHVNSGGLLMRPCQLSTLAMHKLAARLLPLIDGR